MGRTDGKKIGQSSAIQNVLSLEQMFRRPLTSLHYNLLTSLLIWAYPEDDALRYRVSPEMRFASAS
jgi:hypothetical protein